MTPIGFEKHSRGSTTAPQQSDNNTGSADFDAPVADPGLVDRNFEAIRQSQKYTQLELRQFLDCTTGNKVGLLPNGLFNPDKDYFFCKTDSTANTLTVTAFGTQLVNATATYVLSKQYEYVNVAWDYTVHGWKVVTRGVGLLPADLTLAANSILGNNTGATAVGLSLTAAQVRALLVLAITDIVTFASLIATARVTIQQNATIPAWGATDYIGIAPNDGSIPIIAAQTYGATQGLAVVGRVAGNIAASPQATPSGTDFILLAGTGYDGTSVAANKAVLRLRAAELYSATNQGTRLIVDLTKIGTTTRSTMISADSNGFAITMPYVSMNYTVATLPAVAGAIYGRAFVTDATQAMTAGIGAIVAGGGANVVPVFSDGTNWRIG